MMAPLSIIATSALVLLISVNTSLAQCPKPDLIVYINDHNTTINDTIITFNNTTSIEVTDTFHERCSDYKLVDHSIILVTNLMEECNNRGSICPITCDGKKQDINIRRLYANLGPPFFNKNPLDCTVNESAPIGTLVFDFKKYINLSDCREVDSISVIEPLNFVDLFTWSGTELILKKLFDYERKKQYNVTIQIYHSGDLNEGTLLINVGDVDDMDPAFHGDPYTLNITELDPKLDNTWMETIPPVNATDRDEGSAKQSIKYSLVDDKGIFKINQENGSMKVLGLLDYDQKTEYILTIKAEQVNNPLRSAIAIVRVNVIDTNNNLPKFLKYEHSVSIDEHASKGSYVTEVSAHDKDLNSVTSYELSNGTDLFSIDNTTGLITVFDPIGLDRENISEITIQVKAIDSLLNKVGDTATISINIRDINDHAPVFDKSSYIFTAKLNAKDEVVGQVHATDADQGLNGAVSYGLSPAPLSNNLGVNSSTGDIFLKTTLVSTERIYITACDNPQIARRCSQVLVRVTLNNTDHLNGTVNLSVSENSAIGTVVHSFDIESCILKADESFAVSNPGCVIKTKKVFDRENDTKYTLSLEVGGQHVTVNVEVTDVNDNAPVFTSQNYYFELPGSDTKLPYFGVVNATDEDEGDNGRISYILQDNMHSKYFVINGTTGEISLSGVKIPDSAWALQMTVTAKDHGQPSLQTFCTVYVSKTAVVQGKVKLGSPLNEGDLNKRKTELEGQIGDIINLKVSSEVLPGDEHSKSYLMLSAKYHNGTQVATQDLQRTLILHMGEVEALFSKPSTSRDSMADNSNVAEIALIVIVCVMFLATVGAAIFLSRKWKKKKNIDRLVDNLTRDSSIYESQEIKINMDDETSDYNGSLNTQEVESAEQDRLANGGAFVNNAYDADFDSTEPKIVPNEAINECISSLDERLDKEEPILPGADYESSDSDENKPSTSGDVDEDDETAGNQYQNIANIDGHVIPSSSHFRDSDERDNESGEHFYDNSQNAESASLEPDVDYDIKQTRFSAQVVDIENNVVEDLKPDKSVEEKSDDDVFDDKGDDADELPEVDYNIKQARFSTQVLDIQNNVVVGLKPDKSEENVDDAAENSDENNDDEEESLAFKDFGKDEHEKVDEEINSPMEFLKEDLNNGHDGDVGTFHFGEETTAL